MTTTSTLILERRQTARPDTIAPIDDEYVRKVKASRLQWSAAAWVLLYPITLVVWSAFGAWAFLFAAPLVWLTWDINMREVKPPAPAPQADPAGSGNHREGWHAKAS